MSGAFAPSRVTLTVNGAAYANWREFTIERDLREITAKAELRYYDIGRAAAAMPATAPSPVPSPILRRQSCQIAIDGETVIDGWLFEMQGRWEASEIDARFTVRDKTCDLADCAAAPNGPAEWKQATLLQVAQQVCAPFGIKVVAQTDTGAVFARLAVAAHETALALLEKAARQRGVLVVSDGVGGLLLTTGGKTSAPAALTLGGNVQRASYRFDDRKRFSDIYVKGQTEKAAGTRPASRPPLGHDYVPGPMALPSSAASVEAAGILITGHAVDPEVTRYRPTVRMARTQSGGATAQAQAEWMARVARGESVELTYTVLDWRANGALWKPNTLVRVTDPYAGIDDIMLIRRVAYHLGPDGENTRTPTTDISVVGRTAFDRISEATPKRPLKNP